ncbi:L-cysteine desulfidase family protein [Gephyromycinifex aptenodytis]|uniref:L-cysteine desulfidase family protein n=1 Tax=Gephyromycinifex aptenodytis TaxID=2716227 RepID=UPI001445B951|nr:L-serine ammonia-lyase, iron-sulfur-dependent, subunit alpha [Gephyromycinifex aptenodytis]
MDDAHQEALCALLLAELVPALGCTEPIAIALACAKAREVLALQPRSLTLTLSANVYKNARSVIIPGTHGRHGVDLAAALGMLAGDAQRGLECLGEVDDDDIEAAMQFVARGNVSVELNSEFTGLYVRAEVRTEASSASVELIDEHTRFASLYRDGVQLGPAEDSPAAGPQSEPAAQPSPRLQPQQVLDFARSIDLAAQPALVAALQRQIDLNSRIADAGVETEYAAGIGRSLAANGGSGPRHDARVRAAAASDARMGGCSLPVVINSGSGNQGITASLPVITYAKALHSSQQQLYRALLVSNLLAILQKQRIGKLSAFCGAASAASAAGAGIAWLQGLPDEQVLQTLETSLATTGGMVCDGAKPSCAAKVSISVEAALSSLDLVAAGRHFEAGVGVLGPDPQQTIENVGRIAHDGMQQTDVVILDVMHRADTAGATGR